MNVRRIYVSGPMTGIKDHNVPAFVRAAKKLRRCGYVVVNPPELDRFVKPATWEGFLRRDLRFLVTCDAIATLSRWKNSRGANLEVHVGRALGMPVHTVLYYTKNRRKK